MLRIKLVEQEHSGESIEDAIILTDRSDFEGTENVWKTLDSRFGKLLIVDLENEI